MKWVMKEPSYGDMIRVELGGIYHVGIYVSDDEVIQFGLAPSQRVTLRDSEVEVLSSDIDRFLVGGFLEVCEFDKKENAINNRTHKRLPCVKGAFFRLADTAIMHSALGIKH